MFWRVMASPYLSNSFSSLYKGTAFTYLPFMTAAASDGVTGLDGSNPFGCGARFICPSSLPAYTPIWCSSTVILAGVK